MIYVFEDYSLDVGRRELRRRNQLIAIEPQVFDLLQYLIANRDRVISKGDLIAAVWVGRVVSDSAITSRITAARQAIGDSGAEQRLIRTVPRKGLRFVGEVREERPSVDRDTQGSVKESRAAAAILPGTAAVSPNAGAGSGSQTSVHTEALGGASSAPAASAESCAPDPARIASRALPSVPVSYRPATRSFALLGALLVVFSALALATLTRPQLVTPTHQNGAVERKVRCNPVLAAVSVVPFTAPNDSSAASQLAERMSDDVRGYLSRIPFLRVISRQTAWRVASSSANSALPDLAPHYTVEGRIQAGNGKLRLSVHLLQESTQAQVWSSTFEHALADWPLRQDDVAGHLAHRLHFETIRREGNNLPDNIDELSIQQLLGGGWAMMISPGGVSSAKLHHAEKVFGEVLRRDPACTSAMIGLAGAKALRATNLMGDRDKQKAEADALLRTAQYRGPDNFLVHFYFGILRNMENNVPAALQAYDRALELNPTFAPSHAYRGRLLIKMSRYEDALNSIGQAYRLAGEIGAWQLWQGIAQLELGQDEAAGESFRRALAVIPENPYANAAMAGYYALRGQLKDAAQHVDNVRRRTPGKSDQWRLLEFNKGPGDQPLPNRLGEAVRLALEAHPESP